MIEAQSNNRTALLRMKSAFVFKLNANGREQFARWSRPWLGVAKGTVRDVDARRHLGRPRGTGLMTLDDFRKDWTMAYEGLSTFSGRRPLHKEIARSMGFNWWDKGHLKPTSTYFDYVKRSGLTRS